MKEVGVYRIFNLRNGKSYIGQSRDLRHRYNEHVNLLRKGKDGCSILNKAWAKYGEENFGYEVLCYCSEEELDDKERFFIAEYDSLKNGYNCTEGGGGISGYHHTPEAKRKIGDAFRGRVIPEEFRRLSSERQKGKKLTPEHRQALSEAWTEERKERLSKSRSGVNNPNFGKTGADACNKTPVVASTGEEFATIADAARWCGLSSRGNISSCCRGKREYAGRHPETNQQLSWSYKFA